MWEDLEATGLEAKEALLYVAVLELGRPTVAQAAKAANISRTNAYDVVRRLAARGLVTVTETGPTGEPAGRGRAVLAATDPEQLMTQWRERGEVLTGLVPRLKAVMATHTARPRVRYLEGPTGIRAALWEVLGWGVPLKGILSMSDLLQTPGSKVMDEFIDRRCSLGISLDVIRSREKEATAVWPTSTRMKRRVRFAPEAHVFTMTMFVGTDAVAVISSRHENFAMMIESPEYTDLQAKLFDSLWEASTPDE